MSDPVFNTLLNDETIRMLKMKHIKFNVPEPRLPVKRLHKISICTNCMNRARDVKRTLPRNIEDNRYYKNVEFVLLNYNSQDDLDDWVKARMIGYIKEGILNYYHTTEPVYYSMTHSRNITFRLAQGDIVNNVDGDHFINKGFVEYINMLANQRYKKPIFVKGRQKNRGRIGMFKKDFLALNGYDEALTGYGFDDEDLRLRAHEMGFTFLSYGHMPFFEHTDDHIRHEGKNYLFDWRYTQRINTMISLINIANYRYQANNRMHWGKARLLKNFEEVIEI